MEAITIERVLAAVAESLEIDPADVHPDSSFVSLGADSLELTQLMIDLEGALDIEIPDDDMKKLFTPADVVAYAAHR